jgi:transcriptional/translational regulatory protein YebC/TACO1
MPKSTIEAAIARGQGISASGQALDSVTLEAMLPPSIAAVVDCQTDNKNRTLADLRLLVKDYGGNVTPIGYLFERKGRIILRKKEGLGLDDILEPALEAGALDVLEDDEGRMVVYTEPIQTKATAEIISKQLEVEIEESELIYDPNAGTQVELDDEEAAQRLSAFLEKLQDVHGVQAVYMNWKKGTVSDELWAELQGKMTF